ncbi:histidine phosphatase family protein [Embleya sp. NPDC005575]|uniref:histidine phosphatase family protein n=1 Tax=Embleya sp. NPDC005575 TaxID=3156892 RepID=UPI0033B92BF5
MTPPQEHHERQRYIYVVRHGQTEENERGLHQGQGIGGQLSTQGARDTHELGPRLAGIAFDSLYVSPAARCQATAEILREYLAAIPDVRTDKRLDAKNSGHLAGRPRELAAAEAARAGVPIHRHRVPGGETSEEVQARYVALWDDLCGGPARRVLLVGHGGGIACLLLHLARRLFSDYLDHVPGSAALSLLRVPETTSRGEIVLMNVSPREVGSELPV